MFLLNEFTVILTLSFLALQLNVYIVLCTVGSETYSPGELKTNGLKFSKTKINLISLLAF